MAYTYNYPRPAVTADCVVATTDRQVLLIKRANEPYKGCWALPGGFMNMDESAEECAVRELEEETGIRIDVDDIYQVGTYTAVDRDPRGRTISVAYVTVTGSAIEAHGADDAAEARWWSMDALPDMAFDHEEIMQDAEEIINMMLSE